MDIKKAIIKVSNYHHLTSAEMIDVMTTIMSGNATPAQIAGFLVGLKVKGETIEEITAAAKVMYQYATKCQINQPHLIDIVGTGGDGAKTFNISTTVAFVVAAAGGQVAKHGNRSVSSSSGSADVLEFAGINLNLTAEQVASCVEKIGIGFLFAPRFHGAMKHAAAPRKELGVRTLFNLLGPLTNPAGANYQLIGVYDKQWVEPMAHVLKNLGSKKAWVVHSHDGLDEISIADRTLVAELKHDQINLFEIDPSQYNLQHPNLNPLAVDNAEQSYQLLLDVLDNRPGPALDIVLLNAAAAIFIAELATDFEASLSLAKHVIANGSAKQKLLALQKLTQTMI